MTRPSWSGELCRRSLLAFILFFSVNLLRVSDVHPARRADWQSAQINDLRYESHFPSTEKARNTLPDMTGMRE